MKRKYKALPLKGQVSSIILIAKIIPCDDLPILNFCFIKLNNYACLIADAIVHNHTVHAVGIMKVRGFWPQNYYPKPA